MVARVAAHIAAAGLLDPGDAVLVGVSGGVDSMVLADILRRAGFDLHIAHLHHGLRAADADADEALVADYARHHRLPVALRRLDPGQLRDTPGSLQASARTLRYAFLAQVAREQGIAAVAVAHHADDQAETFLLQLFRGAGVEGLSGMPASRVLDPEAGVRLIRPLLQESRASVRAYAESEGLPWREDASNEDTSYRRNALRADVMPAIVRTFGPSAPGQLAAAAERIRAYREATLDPTLARHLETILVDDRGERALRVGPLRAAPLVWRRRVILEALSRWAPAAPRSSASADRLLQLGDGQTGRRVAVRGGVFWRERDVLAFISDPPEGPAGAYDLDPGGTALFAAGRVYLGLPEAPPEDLDAGPLRVWMDVARLHFPLQVRPWRAGDRLRPFGGRHHRKVSDLLTDARVPTYARAGWPVVLSAGEVVWIPGVRMAESVRIYPYTTQSVELNFLPLAPEAETS